MQFSIYYFVIAKKGKGGRKKPTQRSFHHWHSVCPVISPRALNRKSSIWFFCKAEMCCVHQPKEKEKGDSASWFAGTAPPVALPAPIKAAAGAPSATWAPAVCYFKGKAIK